MKKSYNTRMAELATTYEKAHDEMELINPALAFIVEDVRIRYTRKRGYFGFHEAKAMFRGFKATRTISLIKSKKEYSLFPTVFWELCEYFKYEQREGIGARGLKGIRAFYRELSKRGGVNIKYNEQDELLLDHFKRNSLSEFILNDFTTKENTFIIKYLPCNKPYVLALNFESSYLRETTKKALLNARASWRRTKTDFRLVQEIELWLEADKDHIIDHKSFNAKRLTHGISFIMEKYGGKVRQKAMNILFDIFSTVIREHPRYNFFKDSSLWCSQMIFDLKMPIQLCHGYKIAVIGRETGLPGYNRVLFCAINMHRISANGHRFGIHACDFSDVKMEYYREILVNFGVASYSRSIDRVRQFFIWLQEDKKKRNAIAAFKVVSKDELTRYRIHISQRLKMAESRNRLIEGAKKVLIWAGSNGYLDVEEGFEEVLSLFKTTYRPNQRCLSKWEIEAIEQELFEIGKTDMRCYLSLIIFHIQLLTDTRAGEICAMALSRIKLRKNNTGDYTATYESIEKNGGKELIKIRYSKAATKFILEAIEATRALRAKCPIDGPVDQLFLYDAGETCGHVFKVIGIDTYNTALKKACLLAGVVPITSGNVRDTYMTAVSRFGHKHNLTDLQKALLTKHASKISTKRYVDINMDDYLIASDGITIGEIKKC